MRYSTSFNAIWERFWSRNGVQIVTFGALVGAQIVEKSISDATRKNIVFYELSPTEFQVLEVSILMYFSLFLRCFRIENCLEIQLKLHMDFEIDFVTFEPRLGTLWSHFGRLVGVSGGT